MHQKDITILTGPLHNEQRSSTLLLFKTTLLSKLGKQKDRNMMRLGLLDENCRNQIYCLCLAIEPCWDCARPKVEKVSCVSDNPIPCSKFIVKLKGCNPHAHFLGSKPTEVHEMAKYVDNCAAHLKCCARFLASNLHRCQWDLFLGTHA